ncbi:cation:proton antiporter [Cumulibacter soli]|uniref:cation:proton antiporter n=1 Tax=Cumulibacter soli TaxID=2546344 RepID=UPI001068AA2D|nr:cation:proton antiporter [Cumulibacter soli]
MVETIAIVVVGVLVVAGSAVISPRLGVAAPLLLVLLGVAASFTPWVPDINIDPELILAGLLPPLLYASAVSIPTMNFRREIRGISGLSVLLVVSSSLALGLLFLWLIPDLGFGWGVALGAILSPTDAVATSIVKQTPVSRRVLVMLDGESMLNDASALVVLRTAIIAAGASFNLWSAVGTFAYAVIVAVVIGAVVGWGNLVVRRRVLEPTVNTILSFTVPFLASVPTELLGASGLVAAVVAGLITGYRAPRVLPPQHRMSDSQNWASIELVAEGAIFLTMGLQISSVLDTVHREHAGIPYALGLACVGLFVVLLVRTAYVALMLWRTGRRNRRHRAIQPRVDAIHAALTDGQPWPNAPATAGHRRALRRLDHEAVTHRVTRVKSDIDYFVRNPLTAKDGVVVVWAGMRGAITVAAAQTLPPDTPHRALLVFIAFAVATMSLLLQGGTIKPLVSRLTTGQGASSQLTERAAILAILQSAADEVDSDDADTPRQHKIAVLNAQRSALLDERDKGAVDADMLTHALYNLDAAQIALEMRGDPA